MEIDTSEKKKNKQEVVTCASFTDAPDFVLAELDKERQNVLRRQIAPKRLKQPLNIRSNSLQKHTSE